MKNKYVLGRPEDFHKFIESLTKEDKIGIVTHTDLDGLASGIFLQKILESKRLNLKFMQFLDYGSDAFSKIKRNSDVVIFSDWNVSNFPEEFNELRNNKKIFVVDHHPTNDKLKDKKGIIKTNSKYCSAHCLYDLVKEGKYFDTKSLDYLVSGAIIFDYCFDDEDNFKFLKSIYPDIKKEDIWNSEPALISKKIANSLIYYKPDIEKVYEMVLEKDFESLDKADKIISEEYSLWKDKFKKESEYFSNSNLHFYYSTPKYGISSAVVSAISQQEIPSKTLIFVSDDPERLGFVKLSARNQKGDVKLGDVLRKCIDGFENSSAGGHDKASAGTFPKKYLDEFKIRLIKELKK
jgi:single-stranded DNA-specific DHH superfamily exonuclease